MLAAADLAPFGLFAVTPVGVALLLGAVLFFLFLGKYFLPQGASGKLQATEQEKVVDAFNLRKEIQYYRISESSTLKSKTIEESGAWSEFRINILATAKENQIAYAPWRETELHTGMILALYGDDNQAQVFAAKHGLEPTQEHPMFEGLGDPEETGFVEVVVPPPIRFGW